MQSGDGTPLKNLWEEVCVQVQFGESIFWEVYKLHIDQLILSHIFSLSAPILQAIWLQTERGEQWLYEENEEDECGMDSREPTYCQEDIIDWILSRVLMGAGEFNNERIDKYFELTCSDDPPFPR
jgi:hypothetical protein